MQVDYQFEGRSGSNHLFSYIIRANPCPVFLFSPWTGKIRIFLSDRPIFENPLDSIFFYFVTHIRLLALDLEILVFLLLFLWALPLYFVYSLFLGTSHLPPEVNFQSHSHTTIVVRWTTTRQNEGLFFRLHLQLLMGRSIHCKLAQVLSLEWQVYTRRGCRHTFPHSRPQHWYCESS